MALEATFACDGKTALTWLLLAVVIDAIHGTVARRVMVKQVLTGPCWTTSAYDRIKGAKGPQIPSAAFDLVPVPTEQSGREIRETPVDRLRNTRQDKKRNPTGRTIWRDAWLAPKRLSHSADKPETDASR